MSAKSSEVETVQDTPAVEVVEVSATPNPLHRDAKSVKPQIIEFNTLDGCPYRQIHNAAWNVGTDRIYTYVVQGSKPELSAIILTGKAINDPQLYFNVLAGITSL